MTIEAYRKDMHIGDEAISARAYRRADAPRSAPLVLHLHGGAFVSGSSDDCRIVPTLLAEAGAIVVSADYPLAPTRPFPQALEAMLGLLNAMHAKRADWTGKQSRLFVAGEEAGGNLAAALTLMARDQQAPPLAGQILLSPMLDPCLGTSSMREAEAGAAGCKWCEGWQDYLSSASKADHPYAAPLNSSRLTGLPPALIVTAEDDLMRDECLRYAQRLREAGVSVEDHLLAASTGWPDAFNRAVYPDAAWTSSLREYFAAFFQTVCFGRSAAPHRAIKA